MEKKHLITIGSYKAYAEDIINERLEVQAEHLKGDTARLILVETEQAAITGNLYMPQNLWTVAHPTDDLSFARGFQNVCVFPSSEESARQWREVCVGTVLSVLNYDSILGMTHHLPEIFY